MSKNSCSERPPDPKKIFFREEGSCGMVQRKPIRKEQLSSIRWYSVETPGHIIEQLNQPTHRCRAICIA